MLNFKSVKVCNLNHFVEIPGFKWALLIYKTLIIGNIIYNQNL